MKLVAQRVMSVPGVTGINAFRYIHGLYVWPATPPPGLGYGTLDASHFAIDPGGNSVLSFLEITTPDDTSISQIMRAFSVAYDAEIVTPFLRTVGNVTIQADMVRAYRLAWRWEAVQLFNTILGVASA